MKTATRCTSMDALEVLVASRRRLIHDPPDLRLDHDVPYQRGWALAVPHDAGVYLIHDLRGVLYVGQASDLRRRFDQHMEMSHNSKLVKALARPVGDLRFAWILDERPSALEQSLIRAFQPLCNDRLYTTIN